MLHPLNKSRREQRTESMLSNQYLSLCRFLADCLVSMQVAVLSARGLFLGYREAGSRLTSALHMIHNWHHGFSISGSFVDVLNLHDLEKLRRRRRHLKQTPCRPRHLSTNACFILYVYHILSSHRNPTQTTLTNQSESGGGASLTRQRRSISE